jgi:hypothetical protein
MLSICTGVSFFIRAKWLAEGGSVFLEFDNHFQRDLDTLRWQWLLLSLSLPSQGKTYTSQRDSSSPWMRKSDGRRTRELVNVTVGPRDGPREGLLNGGRGEAGRKRVLAGLGSFAPLMISHTLRLLPFLALMTMVRSGSGSLRAAGEGDTD